MKVLKCWNYHCNKFGKSINCFFLSSFTANAGYVEIDAISMNKLFTLPVMPKRAVIKVKNELEILPRFWVKI